MFLMQVEKTAPASRQEIQKSPEIKALDGFADRFTNIQVLLKENKVSQAASEWKALKDDLKNNPYLKQYDNVAFKADALDKLFAANGSASNVLKMANSFREEVSVVRFLENMDALCKNGQYEEARARISGLVKKTTDDSDLGKLSRKLMELMENGGKHGGIFIGAAVNVMLSSVKTTDFYTSKPIDPAYVQKERIASSESTSAAQPVYNKNMGNQREAQQPSAPILDVGGFIKNHNITEFLIDLIPFASLVRYTDMAITAFNKAEDFLKKGYSELSQEYKNEFNKGIQFAVMAAVCLAMDMVGLVTGGAAKAIATLPFKEAVQKIVLSLFGTAYEKDIMAALAKGSFNRVIRGESIRVHKFAVNEQQPAIPGPDKVYYADIPKQKIDKDKYDKEPGSGGAPR